MISFMTLKLNVILSKYLSKHFFIPFMETASGVIGTRRHSVVLSFNKGTKNTNSKRMCNLFVSCLGSTEGFGGRFNRFIPSLPSFTDDKRQQRYYLLTT